MMILLKNWIWMLKDGEVSGLLSIVMVITILKHYVKWQTITPFYPTCIERVWKEIQNFIPDPMDENMAL